MLPPPQNAINQALRPKRINFIDTAKGFCILLVVLFHTTDQIDVNTPCLGMLRMPFYFTLSGIFFKDYGGFIPTILKKVNRLIIPFLFFYSIGYILYAVGRFILGVEIDVPFYSFITSKTLVNIALWFLLALFWANVWFFILTKLIHNTPILVIITLALGITALCLFDNDFFLPLYMDSGLAALPFFMFGYLLKRTTILYPNRFDRYNIPVIILLLAISFGLFILGDKPYIGFGTMFKQGNVLCFYIGAVTIVTTVILLCKTLDSVPGIRYIGRYSIIILGIHVTVCSWTSILLNHFASGLNSITTDIILFTITMAVSVSLIPVLKAMVPKLTAQQDLINTDRFIRNKSMRSPAEVTSANSSD